MMRQDLQTNLSTDGHRSLMIDQPVFPPLQTVMPYEEEVEIASFFDFLSDNRWLIVCIALAITVFGVGYAFLAKPTYEATMLIHVEEDIPNTNKSMLGDISSLFDVKTAVNSEIELLNSRMVLERTVDKLNLYIKAHPKFFPIIGSFIANFRGGLSDPGIFGLGGYAWGAEKIDIAKFTVPDSLENREFVITALGNGRYRLTQDQSNIDIYGEASTELAADTAQGKLTLLVNQLNANAGAEFSLVYQPKLVAIQDLQKSMTVAEKGRQSGIIGVTLENSDRKTAYRILSEIGDEYIHQNVTRKLEEAEKSLNFLNVQLPILKDKLEKSESEYNQFRINSGTVDLPEEEKLSLEQSALQKEKLLELEQRREELSINFTPNHPVVIGINKQIDAMKAEISATASHIKRLPAIEEDLLRLNREVKVNTDLYAGLINTTQQLRLVEAGKVSNVRMIDPPMMPDKPARPERAKVIALSVVMGIFVGVFTAFFKRNMQGGISNSRKIDKILGSRMVYASIPHSDTQEMLRGKIGGKSKLLPLLASLSPEDVAIESLRSFRTAFQNSMKGFRNNIVMITSPTPGVGKTFVSTNFASVMASSGKRVLLIDADFRNGFLHRYFNLERTGGLSESIRGSMPVQQAIHRDVQERLDFLSTGDLPPNPSEFILHRNLGELLQTLASEYDLVIVDQPPILNVSDTLVIGTYAGALFLLTRSGVTTDYEIHESIKRLNQAGIFLAGILFNDFKIRAREYSAYYYGRGMPTLPSRV